VGRASNRKKARRQEALRQAAHRTRPTRQGSRAGAASQQAVLALAAAREMMDQVFGAPGEQPTPEYRVWCGGGEPVPAEGLRWAAGSLGDRLFSGRHLARARNAPCLLTATVPSPMMIIADPAQWWVAASVLVRAVVFDGLRVDYVLKRMHPTFAVGGALQEFADARVVPPRDILRVGLTILSVLGELCRSDSASILRRAA
jgi:hypothetical protein